MVVPGGGISLDGSRWISSAEDYLLPVPVLSRMFRGKMLALLKAAHAQGRLQFFGSYTELADTAAFKTFLKPLYHTRWHVYAKSPFAGPQQVLAYLARYTHRVAISNSRLIKADETGVTFRYKDYRIKGPARYKTMTLVHPALHAACLAEGLSPHPPLRPAGALPHQGRDAGTRPRVDCCHNTSREDAVQRGSCRNERATGASLSVLWCSHGNHRDLRGGLHATSPSDHQAARDQDRHVMIRSPSSRSSPPINLSCWLAAANDHAWPECAPTAPDDHSFAQSPSAKGSLRTSSAGLTLLVTARAVPINARCTPRSKPKML
jgi:Putative transposase